MASLNSFEIIESYTLEHRCFNVIFAREKHVAASILESDFRVKKNTLQHRFKKYEDKANEEIMAAAPKTLAHS